MKIRVRGYLTLRQIVGGQPFRVVEAERLTVQDLMNCLDEQLGDEFKQASGRDVPAEATPGSSNRYVTVLVNGRHCSHLPDGLQTELADGDEVAIFPPAAGGD
jgi:molybdopterin synthase sulfur carrier subunit